MNPPGSIGLRTRKTIFATGFARIHFLPALILCAEVATAAVLMLLFLGEKSFWHNEALSVQRASLDWRSLWHEISQHQANMSLYYVLLHVWINIGKSEFVVRTLSVIFAIGTVPAIYLLAARLFGNKTACIAGLMMLVNAFFIRYAQEARGYSLLVFLATISSYFFVRAMEHASLKSWSGYIISGVLSVYAHFFGVLVLLSHAASLVFFPRRVLPWTSLITSGTTIALFLCPLALFVIYRDVGQIDWVPEIQPRAVFGLFLALSGHGGTPLLAAYGIAGLSALLVTLKNSAAGRDSLEISWLAFLIAWLLVPMVTAYLLSFIKPVFVDRFLLVSLPPFVLLAANGLARIRRPGLLVLSLVLFVGLSTDALWRWYKVAKKEDWREATRFVLSQARPDDAVIFYVYYGRVPFEYYIERLDLQKRRPEILELSSAPWVAGSPQPEPDQSLLSRLPSLYSRVWFVRYHDGAPLGHPLRRYEQGQIVHESLLRSYNLSRNMNFVGGIRVLLYENLPFQ